jgi:hypothetical protein
VGGSFAITIRANNGVAPAATQSFTLIVHGAPVFTSASSATFPVGQQQHCPSFLVTTTAPAGSGSTRITESGALPKGVTFKDNRNGTATLSGCPNGVRTPSTYTLVFTATNSVGYATQRFTLTVVAQGAALPASQPASSGTLPGVPTHSVLGQQIHLSGSGFAAGSSITIGYYPGAVTLTTVRATVTGTFSVDIRTNVPGYHTYVAAGTGSNGHSRYLEYASYTAYSSSSGSSHWPYGGGADSASGGVGGLPLADTGPGNLRLVAGYALAALLAGLGLLVIGRRRRDGESAE